MIQVYKKNELFIIEDTVTDIIYPNLTREEALVLLKKFNRNEPEHRCDFAIKEDDISFEYVSLGDKDKTIAYLEAKLAESEDKYKKAYQEGLLQKQFDKDMEIDQLKQQLAEQPKQIVEKIIEKYNLNRKPIIDNFGNVAFGYAMINADKLKEFLDNLLKEMK